MKKRHFIASFFSLYALLLLSVVAQNFGEMRSSTYIRSYDGKATQQWVPLQQISPYLRRAVIAAEDSRFYQHLGVDTEEIKDAFSTNLQSFSYARGFSTITMQVARNLYLSPRKSIVRKSLEMLLALHIDLLLPKERILEIYLNIAEWGDGIYGAEAASHLYFHKSASALSISEAAFLAAILPSPKKWGRWPPSPYIQKRMQLLLSRSAR